eukprot:GHVP01030145.1.p1 GENE.GHVP01030145.1~~GHVP01030145.1.p1  ORF type:complete len:640 (+),score=129.28 GHVP01030145.1:625-2544(+)
MKELVHGMERKINESRTINIDDEIPSSIKRRNKKNSPVVIDYGSFQCRAGYSSDSHPFVFRNTLRKFSDKKTKSFQNSLEEFIEDTTKTTDKSPFEQGIVINTDIFEKSLDLVFNNLSLNPYKVDRDILLTQSLETPLYISRSVQEILFESFSASSIYLSSDSLLCASNRKDKTFLIVSCSHSKCTAIPVINGKVDTEKASRIGFGGSQLEEFHQKILQLKYYDFPCKMSSLQNRTIFHRCSRFAINYSKEAIEFTNMDYLKRNNITIQFPPVMTKEDIVRQEKEKEFTLKKKQENNERMREMTKRYHQEKIEKKRKRLEELESIIEECDSEDVEKLEIEAEKLRSSLKPRELVLIKDELITEEQTNELKENYMKTKQNIEDIRKTSTNTGRKNSYMVSRLKNLSVLAGENECLEDVEDEFGDNEEDWNMYQKITTKKEELLSELEKLSELERMIQKIDPSFLHEKPRKNNIIDILKKGDVSIDEESEQKSIENLNIENNRAYQMCINLEQIRIPEILFQPSICGIDEPSISEMALSVLQRYPPNISKELTENIHLTGGLAEIPGLKDRLLLEIQKESSSEIIANIKIPESCSLSPWLNGSTLAGSQLKADGLWYSKKEYNEKGPNYNWNNDSFLFLKK